MPPDLLVRVIIPKAVMNILSQFVQRDSGIYTITKIIIHAAANPTDEFSKKDGTIGIRIMYG